jgi:flagellin
MLGSVDRAMSLVNGIRARFGAVQNRLEGAYRSMAIYVEKMSDTNSRIADTDMAREMMRLTQATVLQQTGLAMLAQANQIPNIALSLIR